MAGKARKAADEDDFYAGLGNALRLARVAAGKVQIDAAEHLGVSFQQIQKYEKGMNRIPVQDLLKLAHYYEVPLSNLIDLPANDEFATLAEKFRAKGFHTLLESWGAIKDQAMRSAILHLVNCAAALNRR